MKVRDVMSKKVLSLNPKDNVSKFISLLEQHKVKDVLVVDRKKVKGSVRYRELIKKGIRNPNSAKISSIMGFPPPFVSPNDDVERATDLILNSGFNTIPVIGKDKSLIGSVSRLDIIKMASRSKSFRQTRVTEIMSMPVVMNLDDDIGKARVMMREHNISRIPVVGNDGNISGVVTTFDLLKLLRPKERMSWFSMAAEMDHIMGLPLSTIMSRRVFTVDSKSNLTGVAEEMLERKTSGLVVVSNKKPVGVITDKDLLEVFVSGFSQKGVFYQIIGITDEDEFIIKTVERMIKESIQKVSSIYKPDFLFVHVKTIRRKGTKRLYTVRIRLRTERGVFISKASKWDLRDAIGEGLGRLEKTILKKRSIKRDIIRKMKRKGKRER